MPHFEVAVRKRTKPEIDQINHRVMEWSSLSLDQKKIVSNLQKEHFSPVYEMDRFITDILPSITLPASQFQSRVFEIYRDHTKSGGKAKLNTGVMQIGFSLTRSTLKNVIEREFFNFFSLDPIEVENYLQLKSINNKDPLYDHLPVKGKKSIIWLTWDEKLGDPFLL